MDEDDCITISDDEDVHFIEHVVNLEPIVIDLTSCDESIRHDDNPLNFERSFRHNSQTSDDRRESPRPEDPIPEDPEPEESEQEPDQQSSSIDSRTPSPESESVSADSGSNSDSPGTQPEPAKPNPSPDNSSPKPNQFHPEPSRFRSESCQYPPQPNQFHPEPNQFNPELSKFNQGQPKSPQKPSSDCPLPTNTLSKPITQTNGTHLLTNTHKNNLEQNNIQPRLEPQPKKPPLSDEELLMAQKELGNQKYHHNLFDDAIRVYKRAIPLAKKLENKEMSAILHFNLAMTYDRLLYYEQAVGECVNAIKINASYLKAHLKRAEIYTKQCKYDEAVICYEHICELDSNSPTYVQLLNACREKKSKHVKKKDYFHILGLPINFTREDLKKAYRQQALNHHPDRHSDADIVTRRIEEKHFKDVSEAYTFLQTRHSYLR